MTGALGSFEVIKNNLSKIALPQAYGFERKDKDSSLERRDHNARGPK